MRVKDLANYQPYRLHWKYNPPPLSQHIYNRSHNIVCKLYEESAVNDMEAAAKEEIQLVISAGKIDTDGIPVISIVADGSWRNGHIEQPIIHYQVL